jgi:hypothetical protein
MPDLPPFPTDDTTLTHLEHALNDGEFTVNELLDFLSGVDGSNAVLMGTSGWLPVYDIGTCYSTADVMRALIARIREMEWGK